MNNSRRPQFGLVGLGVMGAALAQNIASRGQPVAVWNQTPDRMSHLLAAHPDLPFVGARTLEELVRAIDRPRRILLMIKAGDPVDEMLDQLAPLLEAGDVVIDGGNSWYKDTQRREVKMRRNGFEFVGAGISGGERGARLGPSIMPGGSAASWSMLRSTFEAIAAQTESGPCVAHLGPDGAGHFVKMVHNGIEYGDMQILAEAYDLLRKAARLPAARIADVFEQWNRGPLESFLVELTATVLRRTDPQANGPLVDLVLDAAGQKGTGRWTAECALQVGIPIPTITASLEAREISALQTERVYAKALLQGPTDLPVPESHIDRLFNDLPSAVLCARLCAYAQGMRLIQAESDENKWSVPLKEVARIWRGGCIIRARILDRIMTAFGTTTDLHNLLLAPEIRPLMESSQAAWRRVVALAVTQGIPVPAMSASLAYFDSYRCDKLPQNLIQAQRDAFGAHTYQRIDQPSRGFIHTEWMDGPSQSTRPS